MNLMIDRAAECEFFGRSLFFVGEFGVNDYHLSLKKLSVQQVRSLVPDVIETISMAIERLIVKHRDELGGSRGDPVRMLAADPDAIRRPCRRGRLQL
ncbi:hypothetical protein PAHAL_5G526800 [Panicum hallii]|uniref:Uncharacterized protein n=1 Tax=Panicum hallii TaxID=206008 RepID=A0A2S3HZ61_9POAL|nr:hypothetical protein PAHAL_5G526800 [Panicum hallii]